MAEALTNQAYEYLYDKIVSCQYRPGQELNEKQLLEQTKFGRTPLREALLMLQSDKLLEIYQTRKLIEPTVCRKYITLYSKSRLLEFQKLFEQTENTSEVEEFRIDTSFHSYLVGITDNQILMDMYHSVMIHQLRLAVYAAMLDASSRTDNLRQHKAIIDALLRENEEDVQDAVVLHINHSLIKSLKLLRSSGNGNG